MICVPRPSLPLARYCVRFRERIPEGGFSLASPRAGYLGSAWRGAFGHALRKTVCITRLPACDDCVLVRSCPYPFLFESRTPPGATKLTRYPRTPGPCVLEPADRRFDEGRRYAEPWRDPVRTGQRPSAVRGARARQRGPAWPHRQDAWRSICRTFRASRGSATPGTMIEDAAKRAGWTTIFEPGGHLSPVPAGHPAPPGLARGGAGTAAFTAAHQAP